MKISSGWVAIVPAALLLTACGEDPPPESTPTTSEQSKAAQKPAAGQAARDMTAGMVNAVKTDGAPPIATLKFEIKSRPQVGQPVTIDLAFIPRVRGDALRATFASEQGLEISSSQAPAEFSGIEVDSAYRYQLTVVPRSNGIHFISAVAQVDIPGEPKSQTFAIPVVVGPPQ